MCNISERENNKSMINNHTKMKIFNSQSHLYKKKKLQQVYLT